MKINKNSILSFLYPIACLFICILSSCSGFLGNKTDISFIAIPDYSVRAVAYVPIQPVISGYSDPSDICIGFDNLIYVVDKGTEEIISYNESMVELGRLKIQGVTAVAQDRRLNLIALGTLDTTINNFSHTLTCIYRIALNNQVYGISSGTITKKIVHPFYISTGIKSSDNAVQFTGVAVLADNSYYITRTGTSQTNLLGGPDDAILLFNNKDKYQYYLQVSTQDEGVKLDYIKNPLGIATFVAPPQSNSIRDRKDLMYISNSPSDVLKVKVLSYTVVEDAPVYALDQSLVIGDTSKASGFLYTPRRFGSPSDIAFAGDGSQLVFITDKQKDSLYIFTNNGLEGVAPPTGSTSQKNIKVSFGGNGQSLTKFNMPSAVAYSEKIVYVADAGNHRILRFKLTTDFR
ncbi:MAG: hypothetical protein SFY32_02480 [Bacteroidota bacterium]|nr:hypothetical protein [Bacteroidota bacterium]